MALQHSALKTEDMIYMVTESDCTALLCGSRGRDLETIISHFHAIGGAIHSFLTVLVSIPQRLPAAGRIDGDRDSLSQCAESPSHSFVGRGRD